MSPEVYFALSQHQAKVLMKILAKLALNTKDTKTARDASSVLASIVAAYSEGASSSN